MDDSYSVVRMDMDVNDASNLVAGTNASKLTEAVVRRINGAARQDAGDFEWEKGPEAELILCREDGEEPALHVLYFKESGDLLLANGYVAWSLGGRS
ncbi:hypothetical protein [Paenibacillus methanolicus]|uniref:hypothetical protein n=1 Tax=Paenibacillus methanolicus TaxID=582686 RepID=UPI0011E685D8|nr:hypothetical protein [Paenibacillus methanolicus]